MANPVDIANELNKLILQQNQNLLNQAKIQRNQLSMMQKMVAMLQEVNPAALSQGYRELEESIAGVDEQLEKLGGSNQEAMQRQVAETAKAIDSTNKYQMALQKAEKWSKKMTQAGLTFGLVGKTLRLVGSFAGGFLSVMTQVGKSIISIGASIIAAPFKMLGGLMEAAAAGGGSELRQALEDIRKQFGDLSTGSSKAIITMTKSMKGELASTGLSTYRIFGTLAERMNAIAEYAKQLGPLFTNLSGDLMKNAEAFGAYVKGLGLSEEGMRGVGMAALSTGKSFTEVGREVTSFAFQMGDAFGINGKEISRDVATMMKDVKNFGNLSVKQLTQVTVYARKLGLEFKDMQGVIDKFDNFEDAAQGAAQLSQAFGLNINALELVQDQDPASRFDKIRKAFYATGKSVEQMTRQELKLLAAQTGLSEEAVKLGFAQENQGVGYDEVQKKAGLAEKKQLTQAEAMEKLANSIERMVKSGGQGFSSFFEAFTNGFQTGIVRSKEFREMMINLKRSMREVWLGGRALGKAFVDAFPGVKQFFGGIRDLFNPARIRGLMSSVVGAFKKFFKDVSEGKGTGFGDLMTTLKEKFFNFFDASTGPGKEILTGIKNFAMAFIPILSGIAKEAMKGLASAFRTIAAYIKDPSSLSDALSSAGSAGGSMMASVLEALQPLFGAIQEAWPELKAAFLDMASEAWAKLKPEIPGLLKLALAGIFGPSLISAGTGVISLAGTKLAGKLLEGFASRLVGGTAAGGANAGIISSITSAFSKTSSAGGAEASAAAGQSIAQQASSMASSQEKLAALGKGNFANDLKKAGVNILAVAGTAVAMAGAYAIINKILPTEITLERVMHIGAVLGLMSLVFGAVGLGLKTLGTIDLKGQVGNMAAGFVAISLGVAGMVGVYNLIDAALAGVKAEDAEKVDKIMKSMLVSFAATGLILIEAAAVGAGLIAGAGVGAVLAITGFAAITAGVIAMAGTAKEVLGIINSLNLSEGIERKTTLFTTVFGSVVGLAKDIGNIIKASNPGVLASLFGQAEPMSKTLEAAGTLVGAIGEQARGIVDNIMLALNGVTPENLEKAGKFSGIISAVGSLLKSLQAAIPNVEVTEENINSIMKAAGLVFSANSSILKDVLTPAITSIIGAVAGLPDIDANKVSLVSAVFSGVGTMLQSLNSAGTFINNALKQVKGEGGTVDVGLLNAITDSAQRIISSTTASITKIAPEFGEAVRVIDSVFKGMSDKQFKRVEFGFKQLGMILFYTSKFTDVLKGDALTILQNANNGGATLSTQVVSMISGVLSGMITSSNTIGSEIGHIIAAANNIDARGLNGAVAKFESIVSERTANSLKAVVDRLNGINRDLISIAEAPADLNVHLKKAADNLSLKGGGTLTINKPDFTVNINVEVKLEADEFEKALIARPGQTKFVVKGAT